MTFLHTLLENCERQPQKTAVEFVHADAVETVTYGQLNQIVERTMTYLQLLGVHPGDRVALQLPKGLPFLYLHLATIRLGAITLPLNTAYPPQELRYFLTDAEAKLFATDVRQQETVAPMLSELPFIEQVLYLETDVPTHFQNLIPHKPAKHLPALPDDLDSVALMIYTSGTTGRPKGAMITHGNLTTNIEGLHTAWGWREDDVLLHVLPIFHVHGLVVALHGALHAGATAVLLPQFDVEKTWQTMAERNCTVFMAVPTIHKRMVAFPDVDRYDISQMRLLTSGSDRLPDDLFIKAQHVYGHTLLERYGMTETGMNLSNPLRGERRVGSVGLPLPGVEARVVNLLDEPLPDGEVGEVQVRGAHVCKGYWRQPEKTDASITADGWFRTGDLGLREPDGYFSLKGRGKDLIISGGYNVYPPEVELVLSEHPVVVASAVVGCEDEKWGERVTAVIIRHPDIRASAAEIIDFCKDRLANYKVPKKVIFADKLPQNALGKVQKAKLREQICGERSQ